MRPSTWFPPLNSWPWSWHAAVNCRRPHGRPPYVATGRPTSRCSARLNVAREALGLVDVERTLAAYVDAKAVADDRMIETFHQLLDARWRATQILSEEPGELVRERALPTSLVACR